MYSGERMQQRLIFLSGKPFEQLKISCPIGMLSFYHGDPTSVVFKSSPIWHVHPLDTTGT